MRILIASVIYLGLLSGCSNTKTKEDAGAKESTSQVVAPKDEDIRIIAEQTGTDTLKGSLKARSMGTIGNAGITLNYYSPAVRAMALPRRTTR